MRALAKYDGGDIVAEFEASATRADGEWMVLGWGIEITSVEILGVKFDPDFLPYALRAAMIGISDALEWQFEREDVE